MNAFSLHRGSAGRRPLLVAAYVATLMGSTAANAAPDVIVYNADVYTVDTTLPRVEAFAVEDGKFVAIGKNAEIRALADRKTVLIDAGGKTVTPGFIDSHQHFDGTATELNLYVRSRDEWARLIRAKHERLPKGKWLIGSAWDHTIVDGKLPDRAFLDAIVGDRPTVLKHIDWHYVWVNSAVLKMAGITAKTPVPPGGEIVVDPKTGEPTGILKEGAMGLIANLTPKPTDKERYDSLPQAIAWANSLGITGMHNMTVGYDDFLHVLESGDLNLRIWYGDFTGVQSTPIEERLKAIQAHKAEIDRRVAATGKEQARGPLFTHGFVKLINDGVMSVHTAVFLENYADKAGWKGEWRSTPGQLADDVKVLSQAGFQIAIHSIGDSAVRASLDAYEKAGAVNGKLPNRIEHVELLSKQDLPRFAKLAVVASMTPNHMTKAVAYIQERIDPARESRAYTWQSLIDTGAKVIFGSDAGTSIYQDPLKQIGDALHRINHAGYNGGKPWHGEQVVTFAQALFAYTLGPAQTTSWGDKIGSITPGKWADFVIIDGKVDEPAGDSLSSLTIKATYLAGKPVYQKK